MHPQSLLAGCVVITASLLSILAAETDRLAAASPDIRWRPPDLAPARAHEPSHRRAGEMRRADGPSRPRSRHHSPGSRARQRRGRRAGDQPPAYETTDRPAVATSKGLVRGLTQKLFTGKFVDAFLGIPYAKPPLAEYRFKHPQPNDPWTGELDASRLPNSCHQINDTFFGATFRGTIIWNANTPLSEDCLYLNVWAPFGLANTTESPAGQTSREPHHQRHQSLRPVLVWIFGGGFYSGTSSLAVYEGGVMASEEELVVVSMNYRVSSLGFLYFGRPEAPGNAGLFDQLLALQWIQDNIAQFGGDPHKVTIFGESAGAVSVAFHLLSPLSRNLFARAIMQSGAATCPWGYMDHEEIQRNGLRLAQMVGCPTEATPLEQVLACLRRADPTALVSQEVDQSKSILNFPFVPVVDGAFLLESPAESLARANFKRAPIMLGSNHDEGNSWLVYLPQFSECPADEPSLGVNEPEQLATTDQLAATRNGSYRHHQATMQAGGGGEPRSCAPRQMPALSREQLAQVLQDQALNPFAEHPIGRAAIVFEYSNWNAPPQEAASNFDALDKIVGDYYFTCHVNEFAQRYASAGNPVFMYYFKQRSSVSPWPKWMGVMHGDEISFLFGEPLNHMNNYTPREVELSRRMMKYWANFAKFSNPTKSSETNNSMMQDKWPEYSNQRQYLELHSDSQRIGKGPRSKQCAFWSQYLPKLIETFDRAQCPAQQEASEAGGKLADRPRSRGQLLRPAEPLSSSSSTGGLLESIGHQATKIPSALLVSLSVILALAVIICLISMVHGSTGTWKLADLGAASWWLSCRRRASDQGTENDARQAPASDPNHQPPPGGPN